MKNKEKVFKASNFLTFILKYITIEFNLEQMLQNFIYYSLNFF